MSRHLFKHDNITIAYGYDPIPAGGYFFQVFDDSKVTEENDEGIVLNEGFVHGISKQKMFDLMTQYNVENEEHIKLVALDLPI
jgi:hypothetical protein